MGNYIKAKNHNLFTVGNAKTQKGEKLGYLTLILHLSPSKRNAMGIDLCPYSSKGCRAACLVDSGRATIFQAINKARERKTNEFLADRRGFLEKLVQEINHYRKQATKKNLELVVRLNGTSDISWYKIRCPNGKNIFQSFPDLQFYDYTKNPDTVENSLEIPNYDITFSWSGENESECFEALKFVNVAVPFQVKKSESLPDNFMGLPVFDGDTNDLRFKDPWHCIIGLRVKGNAQKKLTSSFLVTIDRPKKGVAA